MRVELPKEIDELPDGPHKRDLIRHYRKIEKARIKLLKRMQKKMLKMR